MNRWDCQEPGCENSCAGMGGAVGLRAIGWYFEPGPRIFCPFHRPDPATSTEARYMGCTEDYCAPCRAQAVANFFQSLIEKVS